MATRAPGKSELRLSGDPRRPQEIRPYVHPRTEDDKPGDIRLVGAMICGVAAMLTKIPWFGWLGVLLALTYFAHMKSREFDIKATVSGIFFCLSGLVGSYLATLRPLKA